MECILLSGADHLYQHALYLENIVEDYMFPTVFSQREILLMPY